MQSLIANTLDQGIGLDYADLRFSRSGGTSAYPRTDVGSISRGKTSRQNSWFEWTEFGREEPQGGRRLCISAQGKSKCGFIAMFL